MKNQYTPEQLRESGGRGDSKILNELGIGRLNKWNGLPNILNNWSNNQFIQQYILNPLFCGWCQRYSVYIDEYVIMDRNEYVRMFYKENYGIPLNEVGIYWCVKEHPKADDKTPTIKTTLRRFNKIFEYDANDYYYCLNNCNTYIDDKRIQNTYVFHSTRYYSKVFPEFDRFKK